jgi:heterodisulfide reductase subunit B
MKYAMFLGCTLARARHYEMAVSKVAERLGIELVYLDDFACCGFPVRSIDFLSAMCLAVRNLSAAEAAGLNVATLCSACTATLTECVKELEHDDDLKEQVNEKLAEVGAEYKGEVTVKHFARILHEDVGLDALKSEVKRDLSDLKVASHYGCHYLKPSEIYEGFDDHEFPKTLDELVDAVGATPVNYQNKMRCCGGSVLAIDEDLCLSIAREKLDDIKNAGANCITLVCPFCSIMYDDNQRKIESTFDVNYSLPVLFYPQLLGLAMGFDPREIGLNMNRVKPTELIAQM